MRDVTLSVGVCSVRPHIPEVLDLVNSGKCDPAVVMPLIISEDDAPEALISSQAKAVLLRPRIT